MPSDWNLEAVLSCVEAEIDARWPLHRVERMDSCALEVDGRRLNLEPLHRLVRNDPSRGAEIISGYLENLFDDSRPDPLLMEWKDVRATVMPRIQPESIFRHLDRESVAHVPFVNETVIVFVRDLPKMTISITVEEMKAWKVTIEELEEKASENLMGYKPKLPIQFVESKEGGKAAILDSDAMSDGYAAARLLARDLHPRLAPTLGREFYVAIPARDQFLAFTMNPRSFSRRLRVRVNSDHAKLPYPITERFFLVTKDGVAGTETA